MTLLALPNEVLEMIIHERMPEDFESLALSCKGVYSVCEPLFKRHNELRRHFTNFAYCVQPSARSHGIWSAVELIGRIALEPIITRYIKTANFEHDGAYPLDREKYKGWRANKGATAIPGMLAECPYLRRAELDCGDYHDALDEELMDTFYSQRAANFLLTLLPNVRTLILPAKWHTDSTTEKLVVAIAEGASSQAAAFRAHGPSLGQVERFDTASNTSYSFSFKLEVYHTLLGLPRLRHFHGKQCMATRGYEIPSPLLPDFGANLESLHLENSWVDEAAMTQILRPMRRLRSLRFSYRNMTHYRSILWDPCNLLNAVGREVGEHLEELSVTTPPLTELHDYPPTKTSLRSFKRLRLLELSTDLIWFTVWGKRKEPKDINNDDNTTTPKSEEQSNPDSTLFAEFVPPTVTGLAIIATAVDYHADTLAVLFRDFSTVKPQLAPLLTELHLTAPLRGERPSRYRDVWNKVSEEAAAVGLTMAPIRQAMTSAKSAQVFDWLGSE